MVLFWRTYIVYLFKYNDDGQPKNIHCKPADQLTTAPEVWMCVLSTVNGIRIMNINLKLLLFFDVVKNPPKQQLMLLELRGIWMTDHLSIDDRLTLFVSKYIRGSYNTVETKYVYIGVRCERSAFDESCIFIPYHSYYIIPNY